MNMYDCSRKKCERFDTDIRGDDEGEACTEVADRLRVRFFATALAMFVFVSDNNIMRAKLLYSKTAQIFRTRVSIKSASSFCGN